MTISFDYIVSETSEIVFIKSHDERLDLQREVTVTLTSSRHKGKRIYSIVSINLLEDEKKRGISS